MALRSAGNVMTLQPFENYDLPEGWYLTTSPLMTANWEAKGENRWTVPVGVEWTFLFPTK
jgi:hypothetical protein